MRRAFFPQLGCRVFGILAIGLVASAHSSEVRPLPPVLPPPLADMDRCTTPLERRLIADARDGALDAFSRIDGALIASGMDDPALLAVTRQRLERWAAQSCQATMGAAPLSAGHAASLFNLMHATLLRGHYCEDATSLVRVLDRGEFNCASATVLYCWLLEQVGFTTRFLDRPGHVWCQVSTTDGWFEVETTCPQWTLAAHSTADGAELADSAAVMLGVLLYNRGEQLLSEGRFAAAAAAYYQAVLLMPDRVPPRANLAATINAWGLDEYQRQNYGTSHRLLAWGCRAAPSLDALQANARLALARWAIMLPGTSLGPAW